INLPIIKFSVDWWNTLHQPASVFRMGGPTLHPAILTPLLIMGTAYLALFVTLHLTAIRAEIMARRLRQLELARADAVGRTVHGSCSAASRFCLRCLWPVPDRAGRPDPVASAPLPRPHAPPRRSRSRRGAS